MSTVTRAQRLRAQLVTLAAIACTLGAPAPGLAHGPVHAQIRELGADIARDPRNAELHLRRARAYLAAEHPAEAAADLRRALRLDPRLHAAHYFLGEAELARGRAKAAQQAAERFLASLPPDDQGGRFRGLTLLAKALGARGQHAAAAAAQGEALGLALEEGTRPEDYLAHAELLERAGRRGEAVASLDAGLARLGSIITLEQRALALELADGRDEAALARLKRMIEHSPQPAALWQQRGQLLERVGRADEAHQCYAAGLSALAALPEARRNSQALRELAAQLEAGAAR